MNGPAMILQSILSPLRLSSGDCERVEEEGLLGGYTGRVFCAFMREMLRGSCGNYSG